MTWRSRRRWSRLHFFSAEKILFPTGRCLTSLPTDTFHRRRTAQETALQWWPDRIALRFLMNHQRWKPPRLGTRTHAVRSKCGCAMDGIGVFSAVVSGHHLYWNTILLERGVGATYIRKFDGTRCDAEFRSRTVKTKRLCGARLVRLASVGNKNGLGL